MTGTNTAQHGMAQGVGSKKMLDQVCRAFFLLVPNLSHLHQRDTIQGGTLIKSRVVALKKTVYRSSGLSF